MQPDTQVSNQLKLSLPLVEGDDRQLHTSTPSVSQYYKNKDVV